MTFVDISWKKKNFPVTDASWRNIIQDYKAVTVHPENSFQDCLICYQKYAPIA